MRLIDADELKERISIDSDLVEVDDGVMVPCIDFEYNIDFAPTVEAIPIDWLKKRFMDRDNPKWCYDWHVIADCLIEYWEKENGTR